MFSGIITPILSSFHRDTERTLNLDAMEPLIDYLLDNGVRTLFALGSNGEFFTMNDHEKLQFVKHILNYVDGRVPIIVGTSSCQRNEVLKLSKKVQALGAAAVSILPPYFIRPTDDEIISYYIDIADQLEIPIIMYNIPKNVGYSISNEVLDECLKHNNIIGIKDSSGNRDVIVDFTKICHENQKSYWCGSDGNISFSYQHGAVGAISGLSNVIPQTIVSLWDALEKEDFGRAEGLQQMIEEIRTVNHLNTVPSILKRAIELANISKLGPARHPVEDIAGKYDDRIIKMLRYYNL
ncbi:dihydrodipicolinate synthase family protein [Allofustis seminis]|uniref:dihydrodipicolinate synthase family protein n=1 Tax=Allofustis seminis TaxID=166939 RepID=UPI00036FF3AA|nr:dihydrodipicolinate synthase family protein [Allofustis seminis]